VRRPRRTESTAFALPRRTRLAETRTARDTLPRFAIFVAVLRELARCATALVRVAAMAARDVIHPSASTRQI